MENEFDTEPTSEIVTKVKIKPPSMWNVILLNDDYTPQDFVVLILEEIFGKNTKEAEKIMLQVHNEGRGIAGTYTFEIAEQKSTDTLEIAGRYGHPLRVEIEEA